MAPTATVLVVDDDRQVRKLLRTLVVGEGYRLVEADTGASGLAAALRHAPDIVLLDLDLPDIDGFAVTRRLRRHSAAAIVVLSAREREADKVRALDLGADDYVTKPFGTAELLARVRAALRRTRSSGLKARPTRTSAIEHDRERKPRPDRVLMRKRRVAARS